MTDDYVGGYSPIEQENIKLECQVDKLEEENRELKLLSEKMKTWINRVKELTEENNQLKQQIEQMKNCLNCKYGSLGDDNIWCYNKERSGIVDETKGCNLWELKE